MTHEELIEDGKKHGYSVYREDDNKTAAMFERDGKPYKLGFLEGEKDARYRDALAYAMRESMRLYDEGDQNAIRMMSGGGDD